LLLIISVYFHNFFEVGCHLAACASGYLFKNHYRGRWDANTVVLAAVSTCDCDWGVKEEIL